MGLLEKFAKRNQVDIMMFTWVMCMRSNFPTSSVETCMMNFAKKNRKDEPNFNIKSELVKYYRMEEEYREMLRTERDAKNNS